MTSDGLGLDFRYFSIQFHEVALIGSLSIFLLSDALT